MPYICRKLCNFTLNVKYSKDVLNITIMMLINYIQLKGNQSSKLTLQFIAFHYGTMYYVIKYSAFCQFYMMPVKN